MATPLPAHSAQRPFATFERMESKVRSYSDSFPAIFERATGSWLQDRNGKRYLDFLSGCSTLNYGHNHPLLKKALGDYIASDGVTHSLDMHSTAKAEFLEALDSMILRPRGMRYRAQFTGPTGANAVEAAIKLARKVTGRTNIIAFTNGFHGVTLGALAATGNSHHRGGAGVSLPDVTRAAFDGYHGPDVNTAEMLDRLLCDPSSGVDAPAAILLETVQGEGGLNVASADWLRSIERIAREHGALLIVDDIQAGCGRSGSFFSFEDAGLSPDIITMAKSLSGMGLPMSLLLMKPEHDQWAPGEHNGTFRGNCHAFVTARAAIEFFWRDDSFQNEIRQKGDVVRSALETLAADFPDVISNVRGKGMMLGVDVVTGEAAGKVVDAAFRSGLVIETSGGDGQIVKLLPPLTTTIPDLELGLRMLSDAFATAFRQKSMTSAA